MTTVNKTSRTSLVLELGILTIALLVITRVLFLFRSIYFIDKAIPLIVAILFLYGPVIMLWWKKRGMDFIDHGWRKYVRSIVMFVLFSVIIFPPFLVAAHFWMKWVYGLEWVRVANIPDFWNVFAYHLILVAIPEEFYFRGYFQSTMHSILPSRWRILGVRLGFGWIITALIFAIAHTIVTYQWWHFSIFFPALVFGYLRERTGTITTPILFHAAANLLMRWFVGCYN